MPYHSYFSQITVVGFTVKLSGLWLVLCCKISSRRNKQALHLIRFALFSLSMSDSNVIYLSSCTSPSGKNIYTFFFFLTRNHCNLGSNRIFLPFAWSCCVCTDMKLQLCFGWYGFAIFCMIRLMPSSLPKLFYKYSQLSETLMLLVWIGQ